MAATDTTLAGVLNDRLKSIRIDIVVLLAVGDGILPAVSQLIGP